MKEGKRLLFSKIKLFREERTMKMKALMRLIGISLALLLLFTASACDAAKEKEETEPMPDLSKDDFLNLVSFEKSSEEILELAKQYGFIVHNNSTVIYDGGAWKNFYAATQKGEPATLGIAKFISPNDAMTLRCFSFFAKSSYDTFCDDYYV